MFTIHCLEEALFTVHCLEKALFTVHCGEEAMFTVYCRRRLCSRFTAGEGSVHGSLLGASSQGHSAGGSQASCWSGTGTGNGYLKRKMD